MATSSSTKHARGRFGEDLAVRALVARGYTIRDRNWRCPEGELDIVAEKGSDLVFVEVRSCWDQPDLALGSLSERKMRHVQAAADAYRIACAQEHLPYRFEFVVVSRKTGVIEVFEYDAGW